ncbi:MAG: HEAT repeat domain-containing protein [Planctomycetota bacterium]
MKQISLTIFLLCLYIFSPAGAQESSPAGCYISTGDNDWLWDSPPVQTKAAIEAVFDCLQKAHGVDRIYWRGFQSEYIADNYLVRPENFLYYGFWMWEKRLAKEIGTSRMAVQAAHDRGMTIWGYTALFDHGAQAASDAAKGIGPSPIEHNLRVKHPEYVPVDRYGIRRQSGPMEFAYPEVRRTLVDGFAALVEKGNYDGLMLYTYVEHLNIWFQDEYGFNDVIVEEFKRRYGQDIRTEVFDRHAWYRLRGEYVTQFLRELKDRLRQSGKRLGVAIDPQDTHYPAPWLCVKPRDFLVTGRIYLDWERWVREGIVDEIMVYCGGVTEAAINDALAVTKGTPCAVSTVRGPAFLPQHQHFAKAGVRNVMSGAYAEIERGCKEDQTGEALKGNDPLARMRALQQAAAGKMEVPAKDLIAALHDPNLLVRRQAIRAVVDRKEIAALPDIEAALDDAEHGVRCKAAEALATINGPESVLKVYGAIRKHGNFQFANAATSALANMPQERTVDLLKGLKDEHVEVRRVTANALGRGLRRPEARAVLLDAIADPDAEVRFYAARALVRFPGDAQVIAALIKGVSDPHPTVRSACAVSLGSLCRNSPQWLGQTDHDVVGALTGAFRSCTKDDDWTFRPIGNALLALGPRGKEALESCLAQRDDLILADHAWRILYVPVTGYACVMADEGKALPAYRYHPKLAPNPKPKLQNPKPTEPVQR